MQTLLLSVVCGHTGSRDRTASKPAREVGITPADERERQLEDIVRGSNQDAAECAAGDLLHEFPSRT